MAEENDTQKTSRKAVEPASAGSDLWVAYGPSRIPITFDHESFVGPTEINDVGGPLCIVSGDDDEESLIKARRIAALLNTYGLNDQNDHAQRTGGA